MFLGFFGIAAFYIWPAQKFIGWASLGCCCVLGIVWIGMEWAGRVSEKTAGSPVQEGPDLILGYGNHQFGGFLSVRNFGPGVIYNVAVDGIRYGAFAAQFDTINFVEANSADGQNDGISPFRSPDNTGTARQLIDAFSRSPRAAEFDWSEIIRVKLTFDWKAQRREYLYYLECSPFQGRIEFKRRMT